MKGNPVSQKLVPNKFGRLGAVTSRPLFWILVTAVMATAGGPRGRQAALRGYMCYLLGGTVGNLPKPLFGRAQPRHLWPRKPQVIRGAFPSGHAAAEVAYVFGASLEAPIAFVPLGPAALLAHLYLIKAGKHYISDTLVGGVIGLAVVALTAKAWPPQTTFPAWPRTASQGSDNEEPGTAASTATVEPKPRPNNVRHAR
jgi:membrane-associated phospholipid phosphatase